MDFAKFKAAVQRANDCLERWFSLQRLPALSDVRNFSALPSAPQLQQLVFAKQARALEAVFGRLQANLVELESVVRSQERLVVEMWRLLGESPSPGACGAVQPGGASVAQMVESVEDVWRMCRDDLAVRGAALASLSHTTTPRKFAEVQAALLSGLGCPLG
ncbi:hypothetical protein VOLCADRAFT_86520 [Volvox carteri f. nagariensis]|uniref:Uncharacterized protein n=1 Tax=Volvox carteri f. nagariensis TaxID=3068 RepID=D8TIW4_VOLCA|nr:uncharacterized protein VOLCADRAFT_86520 [Volvox carteri f. nagariensis]EFJ52438.1 hypothetical protein VOLCADRAFT_86520 [Volvox carteri f. nagariensis]|eukprot:XP_002946511.1 hypothetical protein VOLCADRAFT_86520 [Volvox carteri f. nagariensis]